MSRPLAPASNALRVATDNQHPMSGILVAGGAGFIGSQFVRTALERWDGTVVVVDALTYAGCRESLPSSVGEGRPTLIHANIADRAQVLDALQRFECRAVVNLAAETHVDRSIDSPASFIHTNVTGAYELLEAAVAHWRSLPPAAAERFRFVQVSTDEVYGSVPAPRRAAEGAPYAPSSPYSASKAAADHLARAYLTTYALPTTIAVLSNCYGPRQFPEKLIPLLIHHALEGESLPVYGRGENVREWLHVEDACRGIARVVEAGAAGATYHLGGETRLANMELVERLAQEIARQAPHLPGPPPGERIELVADRPGHDMRYALDDSWSRGQLDWRPQIDFEDGLRATVEWNLSNRDWLELALHRACYRGERLGLGERKPRDP